jgi:TP901 family phage tail tape measure protein
LNILVTATTAQAQAQLAAVNSQMKTMAAQAGISGGALGKIGKGGAGIAAVGAVAVVAGKQLYDLGKDFDKAYDKIRVGTGATGKELERLKGNFKEVAKTVPNDFKEVGTAIADLNRRLGLSGKPLERMAENVLHLSNITKTDLEGNIKSVARAFVDWEVPVKKQTSALDGLFRLSQKSGASVTEIADNIQKFGSPLRTLGLDIDYAAAMFANFERAGVNMQTMVPGLKLAIGNMVDPTDELAKKFETLGVEADKPAAGLQKIFAAIGNDSQLSKVEKMTLAMEVFGKRAGADMAEAVRQGRFDVGGFMATFNDKNGDSIRKAADETYDFSENVRILGNSLKIYLKPSADAVFDAAGRASAAIVQVVEVLEGKQGANKAPQWIKDTAAVLRVLGGALRAALWVSKTLGAYLLDKFLSALKVARGAVRGTTAAVEWLSQAWRNARDWTIRAGNNIAQFVSGLWGKLKGSFSAIKDGIVGAFSSAWGRVKSIFEGAKIAVVGFVNSILGILDRIPGVDTEQISLGTGEGSSERGRPRGLQRGGVLQGGAASGDSIPAMLERGEYVLNRKAVEKIGVGRLNHINFKAASRFQTGGVVGLQDGGFLDTLTELPGKFISPIADAGTAALDLLMNGPAQFLKMLPKPNIPQPLTGVGPYLLERAKSFITKNAQSPLKDNDWVDSNTFAVAKFLANKFSASISSSYRSPAQNAAVGGVPGSSHTRGTPSNPGAFDFVPPSGGLQSFAGKNIAGIAENMIHDVGSGLHNHIAFFNKGGLVVKGKTSWFSPPDAPNTTADGKHTAADPGFAMRRYDTLGDWFWAQVGGAQGMLQHIDWGPAAWTGRTIDFTKAGLDKVGSSYDITDTQAKVTWLGSTAKSGFRKAQELGLAAGGKTPEEKKAAKEAKKARNRRQSRITAKAGRTLSRAKEVREESKNGKLAGRAVRAANKAVSFAKEGQFGKANKWTKRAQNLTARAARSIPGLGSRRPGVATNKFDPTQPFSVTNLPGFSALPKSVQDLMMSPGLSPAARQNLANLALTMAGETPTMTDDAAALNIILRTQINQKSKAQKDLRKANAMLAKGGLTKKERQRWMGVRDRSLNSLTTATGDIISTTDSINGLNGGDGETSMADAMKELADAIKEQNRLQSGVQAVGSREALRMLSDVISGEIVGKRSAPANSYSGVRY